MASPEDMIIDYTTSAVQAMMTWVNPYYWYLWAGALFLAGLISLAPWKIPTEHDFIDVFLHFWRRVIFWTSIGLLTFVFILYWFYDMAWRDRMPHHWQLFNTWFLKSIIHYGWILPVAGILGLAMRFYYFRFIHPWVSGVLRRFRNLQTDDQESDIRLERDRYNAKDFLPTKFYDKRQEKILLGLDVEDQPVYIPIQNWRSNNMQVVGPTGFGKGVAMGCLMDQVVRFGDALIYIDPKEDEWAPRIMQKAAEDLGRPFLYVSLHDGGIGYWSPFEGGSRRNAYTRMVTIFGMVEAGGDSDFYKIVEKMQLNRIISPDDSYNLETLYGKIKAANSQIRNDREKALKIEALLEGWRQIKSLNPPPEVESLSIEKALMEGAVVYIQGSLTDDVVKMATKAIIMEIVQEAMRLKEERRHHLTLIVDEVSFLVSKQLRDALATVRSFRINIVSAYQSVKDLEAPDDKTLDGKALAQSMNINSQLKLFYGGADMETAKWVSEISGTVVKEVTGMEQTQIRTAGAEEWKRGRTVKHHEEALIPVNVVLTLPHRVAVLFQPGHLATVAFTSPVPVEDKSKLTKWLAAHNHLLPKELPESVGKLEHAQVFGSAAPAKTRPKPIKAPAPKAPEKPTEVFTEKPTVPTETVEPPSPQPVVDAAQVEKLEHAQVSTPSGSPTGKYDLTALIQKGLLELEPDELRWIFTNSKRQQLLVGQVPDDQITTARNRFFAQKADKSGSMVVQPEQPKKKDLVWHGEDG